MALNGINLGGWLSQGPDDIIHFDSFIKEKDIKDIASWGVKSVRLPFDHYSVIRSIEPLVFRGEGLAFLKRAVEWCGKYNLVCILDFHITSWHNFIDSEREKSGTFFQSALAMDLHLEIILKLMTFFKEKKNVYFEILNEPQSPSPRQLNDFYKSAFIKIKKAGLKPRVVIESNWAGSITELEHLKELDRYYDNILYSFHHYHPIYFTHQKAYWTEQGSQESLDFPYTKDGETFDEAYLEKLLLPVVDFCEEGKRDVMCGEFGVFLGAPKESRYRWMEIVLDAFKKNNIGFYYWNYKDMDFGVVYEKEPFTDLPEYKNDDHIDQKLLLLLKKFWKDEAERKN